MLQNFFEYFTISSFWYLGYHLGHVTQFGLEDRPPKRKDAVYPGVLHRGVKCGINRFYQLSSPILISVDSLKLC